MKICITNKEINEKMLEPATEGSAGIDLRASLIEPALIYPRQRLLISAGIKVQIPNHWVGLIFPRSGLGTKGLILSNSTGVIDSDYRGEIHIPLYNSNEEGRPFTIQPLDRVAQLVIVPRYNPDFIEFTNTLDTTARGSGGFGHTGD